MEVEKSVIYQGIQDTKKWQQLRDLLSMAELSLHKLSECDFTQSNKTYLQHSEIVIKELQEFQFKLDAAEQLLMFDLGVESLYFGNTEQGDNPDE